MLNFLHLVIASPESSVLYAGSYDPVLVSLSIAIAILASYAALLVSRHVETTTTLRLRRLWIASGGLCLGVGIWTMHFVGMLAFSLPCSTSYDATLTFVSMIPGLLASTLAVNLMSRRDLSPAWLATGGVLLGTGIGAMHYSGMAAMRLNGLIRYDIQLFLLSIAVAIVLATLALWIKFRLGGVGRGLSSLRGQTRGEQRDMHTSRTWMEITSAVVMGLAVSGMHYTAMASAYFVRAGDTTIATSGIAPTVLAVVVLVVASLVVVLMIAALYFGKNRLLTLARSYKLIGTLLLGWTAIAWLGVNHYHSSLDDDVYRLESQIATQQAANVADNIGASIELLKGVARVYSGDANVHRGLRRFGANVAPSALAYVARKQRWTQDSVLAEMNHSLGVATSALQADVIWVMNAAGDCVSSSNADKPESFVGTNYADREYFRQARAGQNGHQYAVGRTSNIPGLYYSSPVIEKGRFIGAVIVKRNITNFSRWIYQANAFISDANGVIVLATDKQFEMRSLPNAPLANLSAEKKMLQYKRSVLEPLAIRPWANTRFSSAVLVGGKDLPVVMASKAMPDDGIDIHVLRPLDELVRLDAQRNWFLLLLMSAGSLLIVAVSAVVFYLRESHFQAQVNQQQLKERETLYQLSNTVGSAESLEEVYAGAKHAILTALNADRVSILMFDAEGVMRFQSWQGLSEAYRKAADGHSPWTADAVDPEPLLVDDIELNADWAHFRPVAAAEGIRAFGFIPLVQQGRLLGKFMVYFNQPHHFTGSEVRLAETIAFHIAFAISRKHAEAKISTASQRLQIALEGSHISVWELDTSSNKVWLDASWAKYLGKPPTETLIASAEVLEMAHPEDRQRILVSLVQCLKGEINRYVVEHRVMSANGEWVWILSRGQVTERDSTGRALRVAGTNTDISENKLAEQQLRIAATAFETQEGMLVTDAHGVILRVNKAFGDISGYHTEEVIGKNPRLFKSGRHDANFYAAMWDGINRTGAWEGEIWNRRKNGEIYPERLTITAVKDTSGIVTNYVATFSDITASKAAAEEIQHLAFYDHLTRLPNRRLLMDRVKRALASSARSGRGGALLFIDLDNFKTLNDTLGHNMGDEFLHQVSQRLNACVREGDTVARLGGDEFVVMLEDLSEQAVEATVQTESVGQKILAALCRPYQLAAHEYHSSASIGATLFSDTEQGMDELLKQADIAMYQAKKAGRNALCFFDSQMQHTLTARAALEGELRKALEKGQFKLFYQIQVNAHGKPQGAEVLLRWQHPQHGLVSPAQFIPLAEETGLIIPIGTWVLHTACAQIKQWQGDLRFRDLVLAVNVSAKQFRQAEFVEHVQAVILSHGIHPASLKLELTESLVLDDVADTIAKMKALKEIGVGFSMDDFGTGYSSLSYLKRLPLDQLKIDQSFVRDIATDRGDRVMVMTIVDLGMNFELDVIAEGVETEEQCKLLHRYGCASFQGYLFGKPVPVEQFETLVVAGCLPAK